MSLQPLTAARFVRRTSLGPNEYRKNFRQLDREVIDALTSTEADKITPLMSKIYLKLANAPEKYWEREGVLRFEAELGEGRSAKAWSLLCEVVGVASATASKALRWMHEQGIIGYFAGKNGVGIRVFLNRAASSIGARRTQAGEKILAFAPASSRESSASTVETAFNDSYAVLETLESDKKSRAPKNGADENRGIETPSGTSLQAISYPTAGETPPAARVSPRANVVSVAPVDEIVMRLKSELEPTIREAAKLAALREHDKTREWLENRGLPKAARVAQHEAYNVLRKYGVIGESTRGARAHADVGRSDYTPSGPQPISQDEVTELAEACVAMLEARGQSIEFTLSSMSAEAGGFLLPDDICRVRRRANSLLPGTIV